MNEESNLLMECECRSPTHLVRVSLEGDDHSAPRPGGINMTIHLSHYMPWYKRVWVGLRFMFGVKSSDTDWDSFIVRDQDVLPLKIILDKYLELPVRE